MTDIVFADPFGSLVQGFREGQDTEVQRQEHLFKTFIEPMLESRERELDRELQRELQRERIAASERRAARGGGGGGGGSRGRGFNPTQASLDAGVGQAAAAAAQVATGPVAAGPFPNTGLSLGEVVDPNYVAADDPLLNRTRHVIPDNFGDLVATQAPQDDAESIEQFFAAGTDTRGIGLENPPRSREIPRGADVTTRSFNPRTRDRPPTGRGTLPLPPAPEINNPLSGTPRPPFNPAQVTAADVVSRPRDNPFERSADIISDQGTPYSYEELMRAGLLDTQELQVLRSGSNIFHRTTILQRLHRDLNGGN